VNWNLAKTLSRPVQHHHKGHVHPPSMMSRREFARTTAGVAAGTFAFGLMPAAAEAQKKEAGSPVKSLALHHSWAEPFTCSDPPQ
jgi:hypothetical protein